MALVKWNTWLTILLLLFVTRCLKLYKLFRHISLKLLTSFATNIPLALQVLSYFIILLKAWLYPTCSFLTVPFLYWLHIWQQYIIQQNVLKSFTFTLRELLQLLLRYLFFLCPSCQTYSNLTALPVFLNGDRHTLNINQNGQTDPHKRVVSGMTALKLCIGHLITNDQLLPALHPLYSGH